MNIVLSNNLFFFHIVTYNFLFIYPNKGSRMKNRINFYQS